MTSINDAFRLDGRVALITGASRGIGEAIADVFVEAGAKVMLTARHEDGLKQVAGRLPEGTAAFITANASDPASAQECVNATMNSFGRLDILVNNAGSNPAYGPVLELTPAQIDKTIAVNQRAPLLYTHAAAHAWMSDNGGVVLNISSLGAYLTTRQMTTYGMTKAALVKQTQGLALELAPKVRVVGIAPGMIETAMMRGISDVAERAARIPLGRIAAPRECALLALFLASDAAAFITGTTILIDGGSALR